MPESEDQIALATLKLAEARQLLAHGISRIALREAYLAGLAAARAIIFEVTRQAPKTHSGARSLYNLLARERPDLALPSPPFLQDGFDAKQEIDYGGHGAPRITAAEAIDLAEAYVAAARRVVAGE